MRALVQRVSRCSVAVTGQVVSATASGMLVLVGVKDSDDQTDARSLAEKCASLRIFDDAQGKMNISALEASKEMMVVSQFTLYGDTRRGNRPSFTEAAEPAKAEALYEAFVARARELLGAERVRTGVFRAMMQIELVNDGPVTILLESKVKPQAGGALP